ncbi:hypothetical protein FBQ83_07385 [Chloroflexi bacterium CFX5]|nr:hypothetical protein [Chloroflexota bacterium]MDL1919131.1 hypothetical protein [Chloroflexi bacterium CFX5]NUQ58784.1 hypothetical protein [Anaerolineales bacterium]
MSPEDYLASIINRISESDFIANSQTLREYSNPNRAHLRMRLTFTNNTYLEFYEYIEHSDDERIYVKSYSYHWADQNNRLIRRWDNARHFPNMDNFPHHIHLTEDEVIPGKPVNIFNVLDEIEKIIATL